MANTLYTTTTMLGGGTGVGGAGNHVMPPYYSDFMRMRLWPNCFFRQIGNRVTIPPGTGLSVRIPIWKQLFTQTGGQTSAVALLTAVSAGIAEGNPAVGSQQLCATSITGLVKQYGGSYAYSDRVILSVRGNIIEGALETASHNLSYRIDRGIINYISAFSNLFKAGQNATGTVPQAAGLYGKNIAKIPAWFDGANVPRFNGEYYVLIAPTVAQYDFFSDVSATGFVTVARYAGADRIYRGEVGMMYGVRTLLTTNLTKIKAGGATSGTHGLSGATTGYNSYAFARDPFWNVELARGGVEVIHQPLGSSGAVTDPLATRGSIGVKVYHGVACTPQAEGRIIRFAHAVTLRY